MAYISEEEQQHIAKQTFLPYFLSSRLRRGCGRSSILLLSEEEPIGLSKIS
jgi:hypothetical protein